MKTAEIAIDFILLLIGVASICFLHIKDRKIKKRNAAMQKQYEDIVRPIKKKIAEYFLKEAIEIEDYESAAKLKEYIDSNN